MSPEVARLEVPITAELVEAFARLSGDSNPLHVDEAFAARQGFRGRVAHGALAVAFLSRLIGAELPGPGALWRSLQIDWLAPLHPGDTLSLEARVRSSSPGTESVALAVEGTNQRGTHVLRATAIVGTPVPLRAPERPEAAPVATADAAGAAAGHPALVTGGSRGIGRAVAVALARAGHPVALTYRSRREAALAVVAEIEAAGGKAFALPFDAEIPETASALVAAARESLGRVLVLVHAGTPPLTPAPVEAVTAADLERFHRAYVASGLLLAQAILPDARAARFGRLVYVGSSAIFEPPERSTAYVAAKAALVGLVRSLAVELGPYGITANLVSPGLTETELRDDVSRRARLVEAQRTPLRRLHAPEDTAALVAFLAGREGGFLTGCHFPVTGGQVLS